MENLLEMQMVLYLTLKANNSSRVLAQAETGEPK